MEESGFYKNEDGNLLFAPNFVHAPNYLLLRAEKETYSFPVQGWFWFDSRPQAMNYFGTTEEAEAVEVIAD